MSVVSLSWRLDPWGGDGELYDPSSYLACVTTEPGPCTSRQAVSNAYAVQREVAARFVEEIFPGIDLAARVSRLGCDTPMLLRTGLSVKQLSLIATRVDTYLVSGDLSHERAQLVPTATYRAGPVPDNMLAARRGGTSPMTLEPAPVLDALQSGNTLVLNEVEKRLGPDFNDVLYAISSALGAAVQVNIYLSGDGASGFGVHWDDHDVIIIPITGQKLWDVAEPSELAPIKGHTPPGAAGKVVWSGVLEPGSALYIPRGWPHEVHSVGDPVSVHLTLSIARPNPIQLCRLMPQAHPDPGVAVDSILHHGLALWRARLTVPAANGILELERARLGNFESEEFRWNLPGGAVFLDGGETERRISLGVPSGVLKVEEDVVDAIVFAMSHWWWTIDDLRSVDNLRVSPQSAIDVMLSAGLLAMRARA